MPFGITSAPEEFQRQLYEITAGPVGVKVIADDNLMHGVGDTDKHASVYHERNLTSLLQHVKENNLKFN